MRIGHGVHATMTARPGKGDELVRLLLRAPSIPHEDCVVFLVGRSPSADDVVFVTEGWTSREAHCRFCAGDAAREYVARIAPLVAGDGWSVAEVPAGSPALRR